MNLKSDAVKAQEQIVYNELIKYVALMASMRDTHIDDFLDYGKRRPAFYISASSLSTTKQLLISSHMLSPASLRQNDMDPISMQTLVSYGLTSIATGLIGQQVSKVSPDIIDVANELNQMNTGMGHA